VFAKRCKENNATSLLLKYYPVLPRKFFAVPVIMHDDPETIELQLQLHKQQKSDD
jgi:hypothetical protein